MPSTVLFSEDSSSSQQLPAPATELIRRHAGGFALTQSLVHGYLFQLYLLLQLALFGKYPSFGADL